MRAQHGLAAGQRGEVVEQRGLALYTVTGPATAELAPRLRGTPGVLQVTPFGNTLHVSGPDSAALAQAIAPYRYQPGLHWSESSPTLEDAFISLMERSRATGVVAA